MRAEAKAWRRRQLGWAIGYAIWRGWDSAAWLLLAIARRADRGVERMLPPWAEYSAPISLEAQERFMSARMRRRARREMKRLDRVNRREREYQAALRRIRAIASPGGAGEVV